MYSINTQLAFFTYGLKSKKIIVNIQWFKLDHCSTIKSNMSYFNKKERDDFLGFISQHQCNFPKKSFINHSNTEEDLAVDQHVLPSESVPQFFVLSNNSDLNFIDDDVYKVMKIKLTDPDNNFVNYDLSFNAIGKVLVYKQAKENYFKRKVEKRYSFSRL